MIFIESAKVVDPNSQYHNKVVNILIKGKKIEEIGRNLKAPKTARIIKTKNLHIAPGFFDLRASFRDPGHEWKEDLKSGIQAASKGGFTGVMIMPSTTPSIDNKSQVEYIKKICSGKIVDVLPAGSITKKLEGTDLSEMYDMHQNGVLAFTDDEKSIQHAEIMKIALLYVKSFNGTIINQPNDKSISKGGQINEGAISTRLGLKGIPGLSEELMLARDIQLAEYTEGKLHVSCISTAQSVKLIRAAKKKGINITSDVAIHNLVLDETMAEDFNTFYKVNPPLRTKKDIKELIKGLKDGTIDAICTEHRPEDIENKKVEFHNSTFGMISLRTAFSLACRLEKELGIDHIIRKMSINPREIIGLEVPDINIGSKANLCLFNPKEEWTLTEKEIVSKSKNSPFIGETLIGKILGVINNGFIHFS